MAHPLIGTKYTLPAGEDLGFWETTCALEMVATEVKSIAPNRRGKKRVVVTFTFCDEKVTPEDGASRVKVPQVYTKRGDRWVKTPWPIDLVVW